MFRLPPRWPSPGRTVSGAGSPPACENGAGGEADVLMRHGVAGAPGLAHDRGQVTSTSPTPATPTAVHLSERGEHLGHRVRLARVLRFVPARARNTTTASTPDCPSSVHPRTRGEHATASYQGELDDGSFPPTWQTPEADALQAGQLRFIPAHVGNVCPASDRPRSSPVHPRTRGEDTRAKTWRSATMVHPRTRGEHGKPSKALCGSDGSSPRTRGTRAPQEPVRAARRFIPAHAENTGSVRATTRPTTVHPRARGEHTEIYSNTGAADGSTPRTQGTLLIELFGSQ